MAGNILPSHTNKEKALRALQNPALFTSKHYKQAAIAVGVGIAIRLAIAVPVWMPFSSDTTHVNTNARLLESRSCSGFSRLYSTSNMRRGMIS
jgi:hypothetical protein